MILQNKILCSTPHYAKTRTTAKMLGAMPFTTFFPDTLMNRLTVKLESMTTSIAVYNVGLRQFNTPFFAHSIRQEKLHIFTALHNVIVSKGIAFTLTDFIQFRSSLNNRPLLRVIGSSTALMKENWPSETAFYAALKDVDLFIEGVYETVFLDFICKRVMDSVRGELDDDASPLRQSYLMVLSELLRETIRNTRDVFPGSMMLLHHRHIIATHINVPTSVDTCRLGMTFSLLKRGVKDTCFYDHIAASTGIFLTSPADEITFYPDPQTVTLLAEERLLYHKTPKAIHGLDLRMSRKEAAGWRVLSPGFDWAIYQHSRSQSFDQFLGRFLRHLNNHYDVKNPDDHAAIFRDCYAQLSRCLRFDDRPRAECFWDDIRWSLKYYSILSEADEKVIVTVDDFLKMVSNKNDFESYPLLTPTFWTYDDSKKAYVAAFSTINLDADLSALLLKEWVRFNRQFFPEEASSDDRSISDTASTVGSVSSESGVTDLSSSDDDSEALLEDKFAQLVQALHNGKLCQDHLLQFFSCSSSQLASLKTLIGCSVSKTTTPYNAYETLAITTLLDLASTTFLGPDDLIVRAYCAFFDLDNTLTQKDASYRLRIPFQNLLTSNDYALKNAVFNAIVTKRSLLFSLPVDVLDLALSLMPPSADDSDRIEKIVIKLLRLGLKSGHRKAFFDVTDLLFSKRYFRALSAKNFEMASLFCRFVLRYWPNNLNVDFVSGLFDIAFKAVESDRCPDLGAFSCFLSKKFAAFPEILEKQLPLNEAIQLKYSQLKDRQKSDRLPKVHRDILQKVRDLEPPSRPQLAHLSRSSTIVESISVELDGLDIMQVSSKKAFHFLLWREVLSSTNKTLRLLFDLDTKKSLDSHLEPFDSLLDYLATLDSSDSHLIVRVLEYFLSVRELRNKRLDLLFRALYGYYLRIETTVGIEDEKSSIISLIRSMVLQACKTRTPHNRVFATAIFNKEGVYRFLLCENQSDALLLLRLFNTQQLGASLSDRLQPAYLTLISYVESASKSELSRFSKTWDKIRFTVEPEWHAQLLDAFLSRVNTLGQRHGFLDALSGYAKYLLLPIGVFYILIYYEWLLMLFTLSDSDETML